MFDRREAVMLDGSRVQRVPVVVLAPSPMVTVTLEANAGGRTDVHFHGGSQG